MSTNYSFRGSPSSDLSVQHLWSKTSNLISNLTTNNILTTVEISGGETSFNRTSIDLTKTVNILNDGYYNLPDGVQGQLLYLSPGTVSGVNSVHLFVDHLKVNVNFVFQGALYFPFHGSVLTAFLFIGTSWQVISGGTLD